MKTLLNALLLIGITFSGSAHALSVGSSEIDFFLSYDAISTSDESNVTVIGISSVVDTDVSFEDGGSGFIASNLVPQDNWTTLDTGGKLSADVSAFASAVGALGLSTAYIQSEALLFASNLSDVSVDLAFHFEFDLFAEAVVEDPDQELSLSTAYISASILTDDILTPLFSAWAEADSDFGPVIDGFGDSVLPSEFSPFNLRLAPHEKRGMRLVALADVQAASLVPVPVPVPPPASGILLGALLPLIMLARRFRHRVRTG